MTTLLVQAPTNSALISPPQTEFCIGACDAPLSLDYPESSEMGPPPGWPCGIAVEILEGTSRRSGSDS